jgi:hypothetical protein
MRMNAPPRFTVSATLAAPNNGSAASMCLCICACPCMANLIQQPF